MSLLKQMEIEGSGGGENPWLELLKLFGMYTLMRPEMQRAKTERQKIDELIAGMARPGAATAAPAAASLVPEPPGLNRTHAGIGGLPGPFSGAPGPVAGFAGLSPGPPAMPMGATVETAPPEAPPGAAAPMGRDFLSTPQGQKLVMELYLKSGGKINLMDLTTPTYQPSIEEQGKAWQVAAGLGPGAGHLSAEKVAGITGQSREGVATVTGEAKVTAAEVAGQAKVDAERVKAFAKAQAELERSERRTQELTTSRNIDLVKWQIDDVEARISAARSNYTQDGDPRWLDILQGYESQRTSLHAQAFALANAPGSPSASMVPGGPPSSGDGGLPPWTLGPPPSGIGVPTQAVGGRTGATAARSVATAEAKAKIYTDKDANRDRNALIYYHSLHQKTKAKPNHSGEKVPEGPSKASTMGHAALMQEWRKMHDAWTRLKANGLDPGPEPMKPRASAPKATAPKVSLEELRERNKPRKRFILF